MKLFGLGDNRAVRLDQEEQRARAKGQHRSHTDGARCGAVFTPHGPITVGRTMLRWLLLPTAVRASNAWHEDKDCGCHNLNSAWGIRTMFERGYNASLAHRATDLKTLKERSKQTKSEKKLKQALTYELWRSLRAYRTQQITTKEDAEAEVIKILKDPHRNILLVLNNRVYVHREFYERSKHPGHAVMVREACQLLGCPNVIYVLIGVHGSLRAPSRHRRGSCPSDEVVGGFIFDFEPFRTASTPPTFRDHAGLRLGNDWWVWL